MSARAPSLRRTPVPDPWPNCLNSPCPGRSSTGASSTYHKARLSPPPAAADRRSWSTAWAETAHPGRLWMCHYDTLASIQTTVNIWCPFPHRVYCHVTCYTLMYSCEHCRARLTGKQKYSTSFLGRNAHCRMYLAPESTGGSQTAPRSVRWQ